MDISEKFPGLTGDELERMKELADTGLFDENGMLRDFMEWEKGLTDKERDRIRLRYYEHAEKLCEGAALFLDNNAVNRMKKTLQYFRDRDGECSCLPLPDIVYENGRSFAVLNVHAFIRMDSGFSFEGKEIGRFLRVLRESCSDFSAPYNDSYIQLEFQWTIGRYVKAEDE